MLADTNNLSDVSGQKAGREGGPLETSVLWYWLELAEPTESVTALVHIAPRGKVLRPTYVVQVTMPGWLPLLRCTPFNDARWSVIPSVA
ncbi:hypothetical protein [Streptacidiphilus rugosus]|uniref:hypothetical protein n=1 Tax=Streptacidiphilus rugosus TaxID=405783 RepID=UPI00056023DA|nr:hypothetical protein [Streptacidiphilus rugosus]